MNAIPRYLLTYSTINRNWWELRSCDYYDAFEKPKIMWPVIAASNSFALDTYGYYSNDKTFFIPIDDLYLLAILNSSTAFLYFSSKLSALCGNFFEYRAQTLVHIPIRRIAFTTLEEERAALLREGLALYNQQEYEQLYAFVEARLAHAPEQSDVVHDLLAYLAEQMIALKAQREEQNEDILLTLEGLLPTISLQKLGRLWTPTTSTNTDAIEHGLASNKQEEATAILGSLATQQLDFPEHLGILNEEQWKWLLK